MSYLTMAIAFVPAVLLVGCALWAKFHEPPPTTYDEEYWAAMLDEGDWGQQ